MLVEYRQRLNKNAAIPAKRHIAEKGIVTYPYWVGIDIVHGAHRAVLLKRDSSYSRYGWTEDYEDYRTPFAHILNVGISEQPVTSDSMEELRAILYGHTKHMRRRIWQKAKKTLIATLIQEKNDEVY